MLNNITIINNININNYNNPRLKVHVIKLKNKNMIKVMGHVFQDECWEKHSSGCSFGLLWLREIDKDINKGIEKAKRH